MSEAVAIIRIIDALLAAGINVAATAQRVEAMRAASGGHLTDAQVRELAQQAHESVARLG